jgi:hypothetical protein
MARDHRDYRLDLSSATPTDDAASAGAGRPYLAVHFACCNVYQRIYRCADGSAYRGRCPRCGKTVNFPVGTGGTECRFFRVS